MKRTIAMALWALCASGMTLASAAEPPHAASLDDRLVASQNRGAFGTCGARDGAVAMLAERRDAATLAAADAVFQRCLHAAGNQAEVIAADLGIATTAFFLGREHAGRAAVADYDRAAGYAREAASRAKMNGYANAFPVASSSATSYAPPSGANHLVTGVAEDSAVTRQMTLDPASVFQRRSDPPQIPQPAAATPVSTAFELAVDLESAAGRARREILSAK